MRDTTCQHYECLWANMEILSDWRTRVSEAAGNVARGRACYRIVGEALKIPWPVVGAIHELEASCNWVLGLHCGQRWDQETTLVPAGKGPFGSWIAAAIDALVAWNDKAEWGIGQIGKRFERYNGLGYAGRNVESPYLWSGSNHGVDVGKYVADGRYDPWAVSQLAGAMCLLRRLVDSGKWSPNSE